MKNEKDIKPASLGRPTNLGAERIEYRPNNSSVIKGRCSLHAASDDNTSAQKSIVVYGDGSVSSPDGAFHTGRLEIRLDDMDAAMLAAELINQLSGPYLTRLYAGLDPQRAKVFKAFRHQFRVDVEADVHAFDLATDYVR